MHCGACAQSRHGLVIQLSYSEVWHDRGTANRAKHRRMSGMEFTFNGRIRFGAA
jgi:hypothetical protein